jgi:hypothetical protein
MRAIRAFGALFLVAGAMTFGLSGPAHAAATLAVTNSGTDPPRPPTRQRRSRWMTM